MPWRILIALVVLLPCPPVQAVSRGDYAAPDGTVNEPDATSPDEVFAQMRESFRADRARGKHLRFQFNFKDPQGGEWWIEVKDGAYRMGKGTITHPDVAFGCTGSDWVRLSNGTLNGVKAFVTGRLSISGDQSAARKLDEIFP